MFSRRHAENISNETPFHFGEMKICWGNKSKHENLLAIVGENDSVFPFFSIVLVHQKVNGCVNTKE